MFDPAPAWVQAAGFFFAKRRISLSACWELDFDDMDTLDGVADDFESVGEGAYVVQDDLTGRVLWIGDASGISAAISLASMATSCVGRLNENYVTVIKVPAEVRQSLQSTNSDEDRQVILDNFIFDN